jgi:DNA-binding PadR family transcriptional regulator
MPDSLSGPLSLAVLASVARLGDAAHGLAIRRDLAERLQREYSVGAVYTTLARLEAKGLVAASLSEPLPVRGGRSRREFRLTAGGVAELRAARDRESLRWGDLDHLLLPEGC